MSDELNIVHVIADYETIQTAIVRGNKSAIDLLTLAHHALGNDCLHVTEEYIVRVIDILQKNIEIRKDFLNVR